MVHTKYKIQNTKYRPKAFTLLELLIVIGITTVLSGVGITYYAAQRRAKTLEAATQEIVGYLRYAQHKSIAQEEGKQWGVHFENPTSGRGLYSLYTGATYSSSVETRYLPAGIQYTDPTAGNSTDVSFNKLTGTSATSTTQSITIQSGTLGATTTISISPEGIVSY